MGNIDKMAAIVAHDFKVELLCRSENAALYWATREGMWHFIEQVDQGGVVSLYQWHIPRFTMADQLRKVQSVSSAYYPIYSELAPGLTLVLHAPGKFSIVTGSLSSTTPVPAAVEKQLRKDLKILVRAKSEVSCDSDDDFSLAGATTPEGTPVCSSSEELIAAIAFEWLTTGGLYAFSFGAYSAHCTCLDFKESERMSDAYIANLVDDSLAEDVSETRKDVREWFAETERRLFNRPIWSEYGKTNSREASRALSKAMAKLTRTQRVQFLWLNVMFEPSVMMPLAVLSGVISFEEYANVRSAGRQPDSSEEQALRMEIAWIKLYGELAGDNPVPRGFEVVERPSMLADGEEISETSGMTRSVKPPRTTRRVTKVKPVKARAAKRKVVARAQPKRVPAKRVALKTAATKRTTSKKGARRR